MSQGAIAAAATLFRAFKILSLAAALLVFAGCRSLPPVKVTQLVPASASALDRVVQVVKKEDRVERPYEVLGVVSALGLHGEVAIKGKAIEEMQRAASALGADALIGYYEDSEGMVTASNWASALAVRFVPEAQAAQQPIGNFMVAIPRVLADETNLKKDDGESANKWSRKLARMMLASKGYYAVEVDQIAPANLVDELGVMDASGLEKYGGSRTDMVLGMQFVASKKSTIIIAGIESSTIELAMYSKSEKKVTWQNVGEGAGSMGWMANMILPDAKKVISIRSALDEAFKTLPDISTETKKKRS